MISSRLRLVASALAAVALTAAAAGSQPSGPEGPALSAAVARHAAPDNLVNQILEGSGAMPRFAAPFDDAGTAAVVNFVRGALNGAGDMIDAAFVARIRG